jgi:hypothetical protein
MKNETEWKENPLWKIAYDNQNVRLYYILKPVLCFSENSGYEIEEAPW